MPHAAANIFPVSVENGHVAPGQVLWFFGLSGAGKTTLAGAIARRLHAAGRPLLQLDGDVLRSGLCSDLGFSDADRTENIRRAAGIARLAAAQGIWVLASFITPRESMRRLALDLVGRERMNLIWVDTPLDVCQQRDPKGLYRRAGEGSVPLLTGVGSPFESPEFYDLRLRGADSTVEAMADQVMEFCTVGTKAGAR